MIVAPRSNNLMASDRITSEFPDILPIRESLIKCVLRRGRGQHMLPGCDESALPAGARGGWQRAGKAASRCRLRGCVTSLRRPAPPPPACCRYVFEPAAANKEETLKAVKQMRGR